MTYSARKAQQFAARSSDKKSMFPRAARIFVGVEVVFGLCGDTSLPLYDALARLGSLKHILTRDERHAAYMADGYARATGRMGVCMVVPGPEMQQFLRGDMQCHGVAPLLGRRWSDRSVATVATSGRIIGAAT